jgi:hypothetical protein
LRSEGAHHPVSGTITRRGAGEAAREPRGPILAAAPGRPAWLTPASLAIAACTALALGLRVLLLSRPGYLLGVTEYDDGPYFGSAVDLLHGVVPYRDFIFVQPPGITLLMLPAAALSKLAGTATAMTAGRLLTTLASCAAVTAAGLLTRHRGLAAVLVSSGLVAVYPDDVLTSRTVLVEPWLTLFCLTGALLVLEGDQFAARPRRLLAGGLAFGFAGTVEVWAIFPVLVLAGLLLPGLRRPGGRRRAAAFTAGVTAGFALPVLPFAALAPRRFYQSLYVAQVAPRARDARVPVGARLSHMLGLANLPLGAHPRLLLETAAWLLVAAVVAAVAVGWLITRRPPPALDRFAVTTAAGVGLIFLWPDQFHYHFTVFLAPFLALAVALPVARLASAAGVDGWRLPGRPPARALRLGAPAAALAALAIAIFALDQASYESRRTLPYGVVPAQVDRIIPSGGCVATDQVSYLLMANRFSPDLPGCPHMLDGLGSDLAFSGGLKPGTGAALVPAVRALWRQEFSRAQFAWLSYNAYRRVAWTPELRAYLQAHFTPVLRDGWHDTLYARRP